MSSRYWPLPLIVVCFAGPAWAGDHRADFEVGLVANPQSGEAGIYAAAVVAVSKKGPISPAQAASAKDDRDHQLETHPFAVVFSHGSTDGFKSYADTFGVRYTQVIPGTYDKKTLRDGGHVHPWGFALFEASTGFYRAPSGKHAIYSVSGGFEAYLSNSRKLGLRAQVGYAWLDHDDVEDHVRIIGGIVWRIPMLR